MKPQGTGMPPRSNGAKLLADGMKIACGVWDRTGLAEQARAANEWIELFETDELAIELLELMRERRRRRTNMPCLRTFGERVRHARCELSQAQVAERMEAKTGRTYSPQAAEKTKVDWLRYLQRIEEAWGPLAVANLEPKHVVALRDKFANTPAAANNLLRCLSAMISWSVLRGWRSDNPCLIVPKLNRSVPYAPWPWSAIELVRDNAPPELWWAAAVALYSGQRQGDVLRMKWNDIRDGLMWVVQEKTGTHLEVPVHRDLAAVLATIPKQSIFILTNSNAAPWTKDGFRTSWGRMTERLKLELVFHGLRKSAVVMLLEAGCTDAEVGSITGQSRKMVEHYAQQVNRRRLAASAILKWENSR